MALIILAGIAGGTLCFAGVDDLPTVWQRSSRPQNLVFLRGNPLLETANNSIDSEQPKKANPSKDGDAKPMGLNSRYAGI